MVHGLFIRGTNPPQARNRANFTNFILTLFNDNVKLIICELNNLVSLRTNNALHF